MLQMIGRQGAVTGGEAGAVQIRQLFGVQLDGQSVRLGGIEHPHRLGRAKADTFAETVDRRCKAFSCYGRDDALAHLVDIGVGAANIFGRYGVGGQQRGGDADRAVPHQSAGGQQHFELVGQGQAVTRLDLHRGDAVAQQGVQARQGLRDQLVFAGQACLAHGRQDTASGARNVFVSGAIEPQLKFMGAIAGEDEMGMRIDQAGTDPAPVAIGRRSSQRRRVSGRTGIDDAAVFRRHDTIVDKPESIQHGHQAGVLPDMITSHEPPDCQPDCKTENNVYTLY